MFNGTDFIYIFQAIRRAVNVSKYPLNTTCTVMQYNINDHCVREKLPSFPKRCGSIYNNKCSFYSIKQEVYYMQLYASLTML